MYADDVAIYHKINNDNDYNNFKAGLSAIQTYIFVNRIVNNE